MKKKSKRNWKLRIGVGFIILVLIASLTSTLWVPKDPYFMETYRSMPQGDGTVEYSNPPYPIGEINWASSDMFGRDIFSRLVIGAKMTFAIVFLLTIGKMLLAIPMGMLAGGGKNKVLNKLTEYWAFVFSGFPTLIAAVFIFSMPIFSQLSFWTRIVIMSIIIVLMEWARISLIIKGRTEQIMKEPYIEGAKVLGRSQAGILRVHVWRMIFPDVIVLFVFESARSLMLLGQMAMLGVYFLDTIRIDNDPAPPVLTSLTPEWGTMLGESRIFIFSNPLITFIIAGTIVITTIALNMIGEGLKDKYLFPVPKKSRSLTSVLTWKRPVWQRVAIGLIAAIIIVAGVMLPKLTTTEAVGAYSELESGLKSLNERYINHDKAKMAAEMIASEWEKIGIQPVQETFLSEKKFGIKRQYKDQASVTLHQGEQQLFYEKEENVFQLPDVTVEMGEVTAPLIFVTVEDQNMFSERLLEGEYDGKIVVLPITEDNRYYWENMSDFVRYSLMESDIKGLIYSFSDDQFFFKLDRRYSVKAKLEDLSEDMLNYFPVFVMKNEAAAELSKSSSATLTVELESVKSINVEAQIGSHYDPSKRTVIFYTYYDQKFNLSLTKEQRDSIPDTSADSVVTLTRLAQMLKSKQDRADFNYFFLAIDGTQGKQYGFKHWLSQHPEISKSEPFMVQITNEKVPERFEKVGATIATLTHNIFSQGERNATERALSVSAWKEGMVPYHGKSAINIPDPLNSPIKHINIISDDERLLSFALRFVDNLEHEYEVLFGSFEGAAIQENKMKEQLKELSQEVKIELNKAFKEIFKSRNKEAFLSLQNENNALFLEEQARWFDIVMQGEYTVEAKTLWVNLSDFEHGDTKLRIFVRDPIRQTSSEYDVMFNIVETETGWKLDGLPQEQLSFDGGIIRYEANDQRYADEMKTKLEKALVLYGQQFNWKPSEGLTVRLYRDTDAMLATVPTLPYFLPDLDNNGIISSDLTVKLPANATAEQVVQAIGKAMLMDITGGNVSRMVEEGLVSVISLATDYSQQEWTYDLQRSEEKLISIMNGREYSHLQTLMMPTLDQLLEPGFKDNYFYNAARFFAYYLLKEKGQDTVFQLFKKLHQADGTELLGAAKDQASFEATKRSLQQQFGSYDALANEWNSFSESLKKLGMIEEKE